jgi:hypothetical protein
MVSCITNLHGSLPSVRSGSKLIATKDNTCFNMSTLHHMCLLSLYPWDSPYCTKFLHRTPSLPDAMIWFSTACALILLVSLIVALGLVLLVPSIVACMLVSLVSLILACVLVLLVSLIVACALVLLVSSIVEGAHLSIVRCCTLRCDMLSSREMVRETVCFNLLLCVYIMVSTIGAR